MQLRGDQLRLGPGRGYHPWRLLVLAGLIAGGVFLLQQRQSGQIQPLFLATPTATRTVRSFQEEAQAYISSGNLPGAISSYQEALKHDPNNADLWAQLARIQTYYSALQSNHVETLNQLSEARQSIDRASKLAPDDGFVEAIRGRVYDWSAAGYQQDNKGLFDQFLTEAEQAVSNARRLEPNNALAQAYLAEVQVDQGNYLTAYDSAQAAVNSIESSGQIGEGGLDAIDAYWVFGIVAENNGDYTAAIKSYEKGVQINPNLTFLYLRIGANYRRLAANATNLVERTQLVDQSLSAFDRAAKINTQNKIQDPTPYLSIGRTYMQEGEFFIAARNVETAVLLDPSNPALYGFLGEVYYRARNYESSLLVLKCAVSGCDTHANGDLLCNKIQIVLCNDPNKTVDDYGHAVTGLPLASDSLEYYYTYASALAFLAGSPGYENNCSIADGLFQQLMAGYGDDPTVAAIVSDNQAICAQVEAGGPPAATPGSAPTGSVSPTPTSVNTPTGSPLASPTPTGTPTEAPTPLSAPNS